MLAARIPHFAPRILDDPWCLVPVLEQLGTRCIGQQTGGRYAEHLHEAGDLFDLILAGEDGHARVQLGHDATEGPHVNREALGQPQDHLRCALEARLDLGLHALLHEAGGALVDDLYARLRRVFEQDVFGLQVAVHDMVAFALLQVVEDLDRKSADETQT